MPNTSKKTTQQPDWQKIVRDRLPRFGHRNWIVVADSAYPAQSRAGIETICTHARQLEVVAAVLRALEGCHHVAPRVMTDAELAEVPEADAPGITEYRTELAELISACEGHRSLPHEEIIAKLDKAAAMFNVLILKTNLAIPYTSVFFELDCKYWNAKAEERLRRAMARPNNTRHMTDQG